MISQIIKEKSMTAEEAAKLIRNGETLGASGFTPAGYPKAVPIALAKRAEALHESGEDFKINLFTGASVGDELDGSLVRAKAIRKRLPYQSNADMRAALNSGEVEFVDLHLSHVAQYMRYGFVERCTMALIEAVDVTNDGRIYPTMSGGMSATYAQSADRIIIELNEACDMKLKGMHDVYLPESPPNRAPLPIFFPGDRIGVPYIQVDPKKIVGIVRTNLKDTNAGFRAPDDCSNAIAAHVMDFIVAEQKSGRMPKNLPYQSGVGNVANAVLCSVATYPGLDPISMYTEVIQDSIFQIIDADRLEVASTCSLTLSAEGQERFNADIDRLKGRFVLRQQEMSNNPEVIRRLGVISMNTALEFDIFGNVNSTHVLGSKMMNGIGGSGDFCRNAYVSIFMAPSIAKGGQISAAVPMVSHVDHNEHSVNVIVTEQGLADLRGLSPVARARRIIKNCVHPDYKPILTEHLERGLREAPSQHTPLLLRHAFEMHLKFIETGSMK